MDDEMWDRIAREYADAQEEHEVAARRLRLLPLEASPDARRAAEKALQTAAVRLREAGSKHRLALAVRERHERAQVRRQQGA